jgi:hypothetical protein
VLHSAFEYSSSLGPRIRVFDGVKVPLEIEDISHLPQDQLLPALHQMAIGLQATPFDLTQPPLMRALVAKMGTVAQPLYGVFVMMHHVVMDGWSMQVLSKELSALYADFAFGRPSSLPALGCQYSDFTAWQLEYLQGPQAQAQRDWWVGNLSGVPELLQLPLDFPRPAKQSGAGALHKAVVPLDVSTQLDALSKKLHCSLFHVLLAAFKVCLAMYSGQTDLVIGSTFASRPAQTQDLMGYFLNSKLQRFIKLRGSGFQGLWGQPSLLVQYCTSAAHRWLNRGSCRGFHNCSN